MKRLSKPSSDQLVLWVNMILDGLNGGLSIEDNTIHQFFDLSFTTSSTYSSGDWVVSKLKVSPQRVVKGVLVVGCSPVAQVALDWAQDGGEIVLNRPLGLSNSTAYILKLLVI